MEKKYVKVLFLISLFFIGAPLSSFGATLVVSPANGTHEVGEKFTVRVIATSAVPFNAVSLSLLFPPSLFSLDSVSREGSILSFWVKEPTISDTTGMVTLEGVAPGGSKELTGTVISVTVHGTSVGSGNVSFSSGQILANDGQGTDITDEMMGAKFTILKAKTTPKTIPKSAETPVQTTIPISTSLSIQPEATLNAPEIMLGTKYGTQAIIGTTEYSKIQVLITFLSTRGVKIFIMGNADEDGSFALVVPATLKQGNYTVTARVIQKDGLNSKNGNAIAVIVGTMISDIGWEIKMIFLFLSLIIVYLIVRIIFHLRKDRKRN